MTHILKIKGDLSWSHNKICVRTVISGRVQWTDNDAGMEERRGGEILAKENRRNDRTTAI
jgi:hypothetical protein